MFYNGIERSINDYFYKCSIYRQIYTDIDMDVDMNMDIDIDTVLG